MDAAVWLTWQAGPSYNHTRLQALFCIPTCMASSTLWDWCFSHSQQVAVHLVLAVQALYSSDMSEVVIPTRQTCSETSEAPP